jgi:hypothetical protein
MAGNYSGEESLSKTREILNDEPAPRLNSRKQLVTSESGSLTIDEAYQGPPEQHAVE